MKGLRFAGLVSLVKTGREQVVSLDRTNFHLAEMFMQRMGAEWDDRLAVLRGMVEEDP